MVKRRVSSKGQITLPKQIRKLLGPEPGGEVPGRWQSVPLEVLRGRLFQAMEKEQQARERVWAQDA
ncbi:MAG: AbrB/MazE/SpoVT family DNA-binding domain-containing protein [Meiothermus ruber]|jgi:hypothetical protein|uniref:AbrB/MazE/SpoVT family DNA-binding domain-containing protein n=1 Tax=Meiothermus ruber TaxID=277 RepID=A0A7C3DXF0_MEIRU